MKRRGRRILCRLSFSQIAERFAPFPPELNFDGKGRRKVSTSSCVRLFCRFGHSAEARDERDQPSYRIECEARDCRIGGAHIFLRLDFVEHVFIGAENIAEPLYSRGNKAHERSDEKHRRRYAQNIGNRGKDFPRRAVCRKLRENNGYYGENNR